MNETDKNLEIIAKAEHTKITTNVYRDVYVGVNRVTTDRFGRVRVGGKPVTESYGHVYVDGKYVGNKNGGSGF